MERRLSFLLGELCLKVGCDKASVKAATIFSNEYQVQIEVSRSHSSRTRVVEGEGQNISKLFKLNCITPEC